MTDQEIKLKNIVFSQLFIAAGAKEKMFEELKKVFDIGKNCNDCENYGVQTFCSRCSRNPEYCDFFEEELV